MGIRTAGRKRKKSKRIAYLGIDPGKTGALCLHVPGASKQLEFHDWPKDDNPTEMFQILCSIKKQYNIRLAVLEKVSARPAFDPNSGRRQGSKSLFTFGQNYGMWLTLLYCSGIPFHLLTPAQWRKSCCITKGDGKDPKAAVKAVACRMFAPTHFQGPRGGYKDGRADAAMMAVAARRF